MHIQRETTHTHVYSGTVVRLRPIVSNAHKVKRLVKSKGAKEYVPDQHERPEKRGRGRPRKVAGALENC